MIDREKLEETLRQSLEDYRLSKDERYALKELVGKSAMDGEERSFVRNRVFAVAMEQAEADTQMDAGVILRWTKATLKTLEAVRAQEVSSEAFFSPGKDCLNAIVRLLRLCQKSADICVFTITDNRVSQAISECANRGVAVRIISDNDKSEDRGSDIESLSDKNMSVRLDRSEHHMHHKFAIFDNSKLLTGSYNWTRSAEAYNRENILITDDKRIVGAFSEEFERLWKHFA